MAVVTAIMATIMAAMSGIIGGEIVLLGLIALPQMLRLKYNQDLAIGVVCASGSLGTMIPPSIVLIIYGLTTSTSITLLFKEAFLPGLMLSGLIIAYILIRTRLQPHLAPMNEDEPALTIKEKLKIFTRIAPTNHNCCCCFGVNLWRDNWNYRSSWCGLRCNFIFNFFEKRVVMVLI